MATLNLSKCQTPSLITMDELLFLDFLQFSDKKTRTVKPRSNPFDEYDDDEFKMRFRLSKVAVLKLLEQVCEHSIVNE